MNKGMLTVGIILLSLMALLLINVISNYSTGGELDYYLVKETTEAAMEDAVDLEYYRLNSQIRIDKEKFGIIPEVTDRDYYTNSFHVPVYYNISAFDKIRIEAPYHNLTNGGHISYIELDGDPSENLDAFEAVIRYMKEQGIGYGSINHPVDRDPVCGHTGIIGDVCPQCGRREGDSGTGFERIRRITGYLVGTVDRFNDAKRAEVEDRVKHNVISDCGCECCG